MFDHSRFCLHTVSTCVSYLQPMDLQTYARLVCTRKEVCNIASQDGAVPVTVTSLLIRDYKDAVMAFVPRSLLPLHIRFCWGHGRCVAARGGHRCRRMASAVAMTRLCPMHQGRPCNHHGRIGPVLGSDGVIDWNREKGSQSGSSAPGL